MAEKTVLTWNLSGERARQLASAAAPLGVRLRPVRPSEAALPLLRLLVSPAPAPELSPPPFPDEMLLMAGLSGPALDAFLSALRAAGLTIALKAVLTPRNSGWDSLALHRALAEERRRLEGGAP